MADQVIGSCSICGGDVVGHVSSWHMVIPPPPARCTRCGAVEVRQPVIPMRPALPNQHPATKDGLWRDVTKENTDG